MAERRLLHNAQPPKLIIPPGPACLPAVDDFLRGIGFYSRFFELATSDEGSEEAAAAAAAGAGATAAE
jgi:hypothetical protein